MGAFNMPPGVSPSDIPGWGELERCDVCGRDLDRCPCPECHVCGEVGNPKCYALHGLVKTPEVVEAEREFRAILEAEREADARYEREARAHAQLMDYAAELQRRNK